MKFLVINGPNINMLGIREKEIYGKQDYNYLLKIIDDKAKELSIDIECFQSNHEGEIVDKIQQSYEKKDAIIINPAAYTHTSIAILDALKAVQIPTIEVHISDVSKREKFRSLSYIRQYCLKCISGKGLDGYIEAIEYMYNELKYKE